MTLSFRTDRPEAEVGLFNGSSQIAYETWTAHRELSASLHHKISELLQAQNIQLSDVTGIIVYEGPGSFTGLRIGIAAANALAYALEVPVAGSTGDNWLQNAIHKLETAKLHEYVMPAYGAPAHITHPRQ